MVIVDETGAPVADASVTATFSGSHNETVSASTDSSGVANLTTSARSRNAAFEVCIDNVTKSGLAYDAAANVETCDTL